MICFQVFIHFTCKSTFIYKNELEDSVLNKFNYFWEKTVFGKVRKEETWIKELNGNLKMGRPKCGLNGSVLLTTIRLSQVQLTKSHDQVFW